MARSRIEWLAWEGTRPESWNPIKGCTRVSPECDHCYALRESYMRMHHPNPKIKAQYRGVARRRQQKDCFLEWTGQINIVEHLLDVPLQWKKPRTCFVCSMSDLFHPDVPIDVIAHIFQTMIAASGHRFLVLTKRVEKMHAILATSATWLKGPPKNIGLGTTAGLQWTTDGRVPILLEIPAAMHFVSIEPMLGKVNLSPFFWKPRTWKNQHESGFSLVRDGRLGWVIAGGESGQFARPLNPDHARDLRDQCKAAGVPFFFKQWGRYVMYHQAPLEIRRRIFDNVDRYKQNVDYGFRAFDVGKRDAGALLDGQEWRQLPEMPL